MSGGGKGDNRGHRRRPFNKHRERDYAQPAPPDNRRSSNTSKKAEPNRIQKPANEKNMGSYDRPQWTPPKLSSEPIPVPDCPYCGKPIKDLTVAISDKNSGQAVHFDCIISRISQSEKLEHGDIISYIGGGRFGIVNYSNSSNSQSFVIKKILEWEIKENRAEWRQTVSDHFSVT